LQRALLEFCSRQRASECHHCRRHLANVVACGAALAEDPTGISTNSR
jgi:hypothetical protein